MRKNALLAILTVYKYNENLMPDAPEFIQHYMNSVRVPSAECLAPFPFPSSFFVRPSLVSSVRSSLVSSVRPRLVSSVRPRFVCSVRLSFVAVLLTQCER